MKLIHQTLPVFTFAQFSVVGLLVFIIALSLYRLTAVSSTLTNLTSQSVPTINQSAKLLSEVQRLVTLTYRLSYSNSESARRIAKQDIDQSFIRLNNPAVRLQANNEFLHTQLQVLSQEIEELNALIINKIRLSERVQRQTNYLFVTLSASIENASLNSQQKVILSKLYTDIAIIGQQNSLHALRQLQRSISSDITDALKTHKANDNYTSTINEIEQILLRENGLINTKIEGLRVAGRARGRGNFVSNLGEDMAKSIQLQSDLVSSAAFTQSHNAALDVKLQTKVAVGSAVVVIIISLFFVYYLYRRIVLRLVSLTHQVESASDYHIDLISVRGNDEIARLGRTFSSYLKKVKSQEQTLRKLTLSDPLTGIPNRRAFEESLASAIVLARRNCWCLSILLIDIDDFKKYNDHYGHGEGDNCLIRVANTISAQFKRSSDTCARYGGEEFIALLVNLDREAAIKHAEVLRTKLESIAIPHQQSSVTDVITVSIGVTTYQCTHDSEFCSSKLIETADKALYKAKALGRNRCEYLAFEEV